ncbi:hypothetical protein FA10DRAFT_225727, partial [Acaromyces ingoldii]
MHDAGRPAAARTVKVVLIGDGNAGKTSLRSRLLFRAFQPSYRATIGADFVSKTFYVPRSAVQLSIWDTAGQERFRSLGAAFYRGADAVVLAFDVSDRASLERTLTWYDEFRR